MPIPCRQCESGVVQAALPIRPIDKGRPAPGLAVADLLEPVVTQIAAEVRKSK